MPDKNPVAIIGMGCLYPKSRDLKDYWQLLYHGTDAITDIPKSHWSPTEYFDTDPKSQDRVYCKRGGFLPPISFDPSEFGIPPSSLEATDTSQLLGLLAAKMALEDCGYSEATPGGARPLKSQALHRINPKRSFNEFPIPTSPGRKTPFRVFWVMWWQAELVIDWICEAPTASWMPPAPAR
jgi:hypothetical protein